MRLLKDVLWLVGIALAISLVAIVIVVLVAWFALEWRTADKIADALFWSAFIVGVLIFLVTPKYASGSSMADGTEHQFAEWSPTIVGRLIALATLKHADGTSMAETKLKLAESQLVDYLFLVLVVAVMIGSSFLVGKVF
jgi:hypothetical protein